MRATFARQTESRGRVQRAAAAIDEYEELLEHALAYRHALNAYNVKRRHGKDPGPKPGPNPFPTEKGGISREFANRHGEKPNWVQLVRILMRWRKEKPDLYRLAVDGKLGMSDVLHLNTEFTSENGSKPVSSYSQRTSWQSRLQVVEKLLAQIAKDEKIRVSPQGAQDLLGVVGQIDKHLDGLRVELEFRTRKAKITTARGSDHSDHS